MALRSLILALSMIVVAPVSAAAFDFEPTDGSAARRSWNTLLHACRPDYGKQCPNDPVLDP